MQPHTFDLSQLSKIPPSLPAKPPALDARMPLSRPLSPHPRERPAPTPRRTLTEAREDPEEIRPDVYSKYFGKNFGTGKYTIPKTFGGVFGKRIRGVDSEINRFRFDRSRKGRNITREEAKLMSERIVDTLKKIPTRMSINGKEEQIPRLQRKRLMRKLWLEKKHGDISGSSFKDAKNIVKSIKV